MYKFTVLICIVSLASSTIVNGQKEFNLTANFGASKSLAQGYNIGFQFEYKWNKRFSVSSQLNHISSFRELGSRAIFSDEVWVSTNPTYFEIENEDVRDIRLPAVSQTEFLEGMEDGVRHYKPKKEFRQDLVLNNSFNYYFALGEKWRHYIGLGFGIGIANESIELTQFAAHDRDINTIEYTTEVHRRTKYLYLNAYSTLGTEYKLSERLSLTSSLSYMLLPRFRDINEVSYFRKIDTFILSLSVGVKSIIAY